MVRRKGSLYKRFSRRSLLIAGAALVVLLSGGVVYAQFLKDDDPPVTTDGTDSVPVSEVNYGPPTETEKQETEAHKKSMAEDNPAPPQTTPSGKKLVTPYTSSVDNDVVRAYVSGVIEDGGTCTATASKDSQVKSGTSIGFADAANTICPPITLDLAGLGWNVQVSYSSSTSEGKSQYFLY